MTLDYTNPGVLKVDMTEYIKFMVEEFHRKSKAGMQLLGLRTDSRLIKPLGHLQ